MNPERKQRNKRRPTRPLPRWPRKRPAPVLRHNRLSAGLALFQNGRPASVASLTHVVPRTEKRHEGSSTGGGGKSPFFPLVPRRAARPKRVGRKSRWGGEGAFPPGGGKAGEAGGGRVRLLAGGRLAIEREGEKKTF